MKILIQIADNVNFEMLNDKLKIEGTLGQLILNLATNLVYELTKKEFSIQYKHSDRAFAGTQKALILNAIHGVTYGHYKRLNIIGVGYRANLENNYLVLRLGYSNPIEFKVPEGINVQCTKPSIISIFGMDKEVVHQVASCIRDLKRPEPYKGKGILYENEKIIRKEGKRQ